MNKKVAFLISLSIVLGLLLFLSLSDTLFQFKEKREIKVIIKENNTENYLPCNYNSTEDKCVINLDEYTSLIDGIEAIVSFNKRLENVEGIDIKGIKQPTITICQKDCIHTHICGSNSMVPTFTCNDKLWGYHPSSNDINVGDIIFFKGISNNFIHRIVGIKGNKYITKGDNDYYFNLKEITYGDVILKITRIDYE